jgi:hypothetical protein
MTGEGARKEREPEIGLFYISKGYHFLFLNDYFRELVLNSNLKCESRDACSRCK